MKKIAFFDTKPYDKESFERQNNGRYDIRYFETRLTAVALPLADGCDAACAFVNADKEIHDSFYCLSEQADSRGGEPPRLSGRLSMLTNTPHLTHKKVFK